MPIKGERSKFTQKIYHAVLSFFHIKAGPYRPIQAIEQRVPIITLSLPSPQLGPCCPCSQILNITECTLLVSLACFGWMLFIAFFYSL